jgi:hypothetical protein
MGAVSRELRIGNAQSLIQSFLNGKPVARRGRKAFGLGQWHLR